MKKWKGKVCYIMKRIKNANTNNVSSKNKMLGFGVAIILLFVISIILIIIESISGKLTLKNETDLKLEYVRVYFTDEEGQIGPDILDVENISPKDTVSNQVAGMNFTNLDASLEVRFKFENHDEILVDAGYFNQYFDGNIKIAFHQMNNDEVEFRVKASNGFFSKQANDVYTVNLVEGYVE